MHYTKCECASPNDNLSASIPSLPPSELAETMWCTKERQECKEHCQGEEINFACSDTFGGCSSAPHGDASPAAGQLCLGATATGS